jgi:hypothetical protein
VGIIAISATDPAVVTTAGPHRLRDGEMVRIADVIGSSPDINGDRVATVLGTNTFSVPLSQTVISAGGTVARFIGTNGTVCDWVSNSDIIAAYNPTYNGILTCIRPTVISPVLWAFHTGIGATIEAVNPQLVSVAYWTAGEGMFHLFIGPPNSVPLSESGTSLFTAGRIEIVNSIVAGNSYGNFGRWGSVADLGSNLTAGDPLLSPLGDFGGPTPTMALLPGSPARNSALTATTTTDQRGLPRPVGAPDIGAYEAGYQSTFQTWFLDNFPTIGNPGFSGDSDGNGIIDGLQYALRGDTSATVCSLTLCAANDSGQPSNAISFPYQPTASDLIYIVERTTDLTPPVSWQERLYFNLSTGLKIEASGVTSQFDLLTGTATIFDPQPAAAPLKAFWRLRIEQAGATD